MLVGRMRLTWENQSVIGQQTLCAEDGKKNLVIESVDKRPFPWWLAKRNEAFWSRCHDGRVTRRSWSYTEMSTKRSPRHWVIPNNLTKSSTLIPPRTTHLHTCCIQHALEFRTWTFFLSRTHAKMAPPVRRPIQKEHGT